MGHHFLLQGIFWAQESSSGFLHCRRILYQLSYEGPEAASNHGGRPGLREETFHLRFKATWTLEPCSSRETFRSVAAGEGGEQGMS